MFEVVVFGLEGFEEFCGGWDYVFRGNDADMALEKENFFISEVGRDNCMFFVDGTEVESFNDSF